MLTSVHKEIADFSITGRKIVDSVANGTTRGVADIDIVGSWDIPNGNNRHFIDEVIIGSRFVANGVVGTFRVLTVSDPGATSSYFKVYDNTNSNPTAVLNSNSGVATLQLLNRPASPYDPMLYLTASNSGAHPNSYILNQIVFGSKTANGSYPTFNFQCKTPALFNNTVTFDGGSTYDFTISNSATGCHINKLSCNDPVDGGVNHQVSKELTKLHAHIHDGATLTDYAHATQIDLSRDVSNPIGSLITYDPSTAWSPSQANVSAALDFLRANHQLVAANITIPGLNFSIYSAGSSTSSIDTYGIVLYPGDCLDSTGRKLIHVSEAITKTLFTQVGTSPSDYNTSSAWTAGSGNSGLYSYAGFTSNLTEQLSVFVVAKEGYGQSDIVVCRPGDLEAFLGLYTDYTLFRLIGDTVVKTSAVSSNWLTVVTRVNSMSGCVEQESNAVAPITLTGPTSSPTTVFTNPFSFSANFNFIISAVSSLTCNLYSDSLVATSGLSAAYMKPTRSFAGITSATFSIPLASRANLKISGTSMPTLTVTCIGYTNRGIVL